MEIVSFSSKSNKNDYVYPGRLFIRFSGNLFETPPSPQQRRCSSVIFIDTPRRPFFYARRCSFGYREGTSYSGYNLPATCRNDLNARVCSTAIFPRRFIRSRTTLDHAPPFDKHVRRTGGPDVDRTCSVKSPFCLSIFLTRRRFPSFYLFRFFFCA